MTRALEHAVKTCSKDRVEQFVREAYGSQLLNNASTEEALRGDDLLEIV